VLDLSDLELTIPDSLAHVTNLQSLSLSSNQITAIPDWISRLTNLHSPQLVGNRITASDESQRDDKEQ